MFRRATSLCLLTLLALCATAPAQELAWRKDYSAARQEALEKTRPLFLLICSKECQWCRKLESTTLREPGIARAISEYCIPLKIDGEQYPKLLVDLKIQSYPTIIIANASGTILKMHSGYLDTIAMGDLLGQSLGSLLQPAKPVSRPKEPAEKEPAAKPPAPKEPAVKEPEPAEKKEPEQKEPEPKVPERKAPEPKEPERKEPVPMKGEEPKQPMDDVPMPPPAIGVGMNDSRSTENFKRATEAVAKKDYRQAVALLRVVMAEVPGSMLGISAEQLLRDIEKQATDALNRAREAQSKGQLPEALNFAAEAAKTYDGLDAATEARAMLQSINQLVSARDKERIEVVRLLLLMAQQDYRNGQWVLCLLRCEEILARYAEMPESTEASNLVQQIRSHPERLQKICDSLPDVLGPVYLAMAEAKVKQGEPQQALFYLERIILTFPNTKHAEMAQVRQAQLQGPPAIAGEDRMP